MGLAIGVGSYLINLYSWVTGLACIVLIIKRKLLFQRFGTVLRLLGFTLLDIVLFFLIRFVLAGDGLGIGIISGAVSAIASIVIIVVRTPGGMRLATRHIEKAADLQ